MNAFKSIVKFFKKQSFPQVIPYPRFLLEETVEEYKNLLLNVAPKEFLTMLNSFDTEKEEGELKNLLSKIKKINSGEIENEIKLRLKEQVEFIEKNIEERKERILKKFFFGSFENWAEIKSKSIEKKKILSDGKEIFSTVISLGEKIGKKFDFGEKIKSPEKRIIIKYKERYFLVKTKEYPILKNLGKKYKKGSGQYMCLPSGMYPVTELVGYEEPTILFVTDSPPQFSQKELSEIFCDKLAQ